MRTNNRISFIISISYIFFLFSVFFQNCSNRSFETDKVYSQSFSSLNDSNSTLDHLPSDVTIQNVLDGAPIDAKQTLESMLSLLDLKKSDLILSEVNSELNYRRNLLVSQNNPSLISSQSIIALTSLAGVVCKQSVNKEKTNKKDLYRYLDFSNGPISYGVSGAMKTYEHMAERFWLRKPNAEELDTIKNTISNYFNLLTENEKVDPQESEKLALFICTGMLSIPESYFL